MEKTKKRISLHDKHYQGLFYTDYKIMLPNGEYKGSNRRDCFAPGERPCLLNPLYQRWFYDPESGLAIRLPRNKMGDYYGLRNQADLKADIRYVVRKVQCIGKTENRCHITCAQCPFADGCESKHRETNSKKCPKKCEGCTSFASRNVDLDKNWNNTDAGTEYTFDIADDAADTAAIVEDMAELDALISKLDTLSPDDRELWGFLIRKERKQAIADRFGLTLDGVRYREQQLYKKIRSDETLKNFRKN